jgi:hypothetical protein
MGSVLVVVGHEHLENARKVLLAQNQHPVQTFRAGCAHKPLGHAVGLRDRNGVRTISIPSPRNTSSNRSVNFLSRSRIRKRMCSGRSPKVYVSCRACCVTHGALGVDVHPARCTLRLPSSMKNNT